MRPYAVSLLGLAFSAAALLRPEAAHGQHPVIDTLEHTLHLTMHPAAVTKLPVYKDVRGGAVTDPCMATALVYEGFNPDDSVETRVYFIDQNQNQHLDPGDKPYILKLKQINHADIFTSTYTFIPGKDTIRVFQDQFPKRTNFSSPLSIANPLQFIATEAKRFMAGG